MTLTAIILTRNNQASIKQLLASLSWCDEIIIIDDESSDKTRIIAKKLGAKVLRHPLRHNFAAQRNFGLQQAKGDWAIFIDSDEIVTPQLVREIGAEVKSSAYLAYSVRRLDIFLGKTLRFGETGNINLIRLARRTAGRWHRPVHEIWHIKVPIGQLRFPLYHHPHPSLTSFLEKINHFTTIESKFRPIPSKTRLLLELMFYPPAKFLYNYIFKLGFLDGWPGLSLTMMMSLHSLLVRLKLYEKSLARPTHHSSRS